MCFMALAEMWNEVFLALSWTFLLWHRLSGFSIHSTSQSKHPMWYWKKAGYFNEAKVWSTFVYHSISWFDGKSFVSIFVGKLPFNSFMALQPSTKNTMCRFAGRLLIRICSIRLLWILVKARPQDKRVFF